MREVARVPTDAVVEALISNAEEIEGKNKPKAAWKKKANTVEEKRCYIDFDH